MSTDIARPLPAHPAPRGPDIRINGDMLPQASWTVSLDQGSRIKVVQSHPTTVTEQPERPRSHKSHSALFRLFRCGHDPLLYDSNPMPSPKIDGRPLARKPVPAVHHERAMGQISGALDSHNTLGIAPSRPPRSLAAVFDHEPLMTEIGSSLTPSDDSMPHTPTAFVTTLGQTHSLDGLGTPRSASSKFSFAGEKDTVSSSLRVEPSLHGGMQHQSLHDGLEMPNSPSMSSEGLISSPESVPKRRAGRNECVRYHEVVLNSTVNGSEEVSLRRQRRCGGLPAFTSSSATLLDLPEEAAVALRFADEAEHDDAASTSDAHSRGESSSVKSRRLTFRASLCTLSEDSSISSLAQRHKQHASLFPRSPRLYEPLLPHNDPRWIDDLATTRGGAAPRAATETGRTAQSGAVSPMMLPPPQRIAEADSTGSAIGLGLDLGLEEAAEPLTRVHILSDIRSRASSAKAPSSDAEASASDAADDDDSDADLELSPNLDEAVRESCQIVASISASEEVSHKPGLYMDANSSAVERSESLPSSTASTTSKSQHRLGRTTFGDLSTFSSFSRVYADLRGSRRRGSAAGAADADNDEDGADADNDDDDGDEQVLWSSLDRKWSSSGRSIESTIARRRSRFDSVLTAGGESIADSRYSQVSSVCSSMSYQPRCPPPAEPLPPVPCVSAPPPSTSSSYSSSSQPVKRSTFGEVSDLTSPSALQTIIEDDKSLCEVPEDGCAQTFDEAMQRRKSSRLRVGSPAAHRYHTLPVEGRGSSATPTSASSLLDAQQRPPSLSSSSSSRHGSIDVGKRRSYAPPISAVASSTGCRNSLRASAAVRLR